MARITSIDDLMFPLTGKRHITLSLNRRYTGLKPGRRALLYLADEQLHWQSVARCHQLMAIGMELFGMGEAGS